MNKPFIFRKNFVNFAIALFSSNCILGIMPLGLLPSRAQAMLAEKTDVSSLEKAGQKIEVGDYPGAIKDLTEAIRLNPNDPEAYLARGAAYMLSGNTQKAIEDCNQSIRLNPNYADAYTVRAMFSLLLEMQKIKEDLTKATNLYQQQGKTSNAQEIRDFIAQLEQYSFEKLH